MYLLLSFVVSFVFSLIPIASCFMKKAKKKIGLKYLIKNNKYSFVASIILFLGSFFRLILIDKYPFGLNQDEASIGYEAYSILKYGIDRNGISLPVHLISWGSGQNALYAYMIMPLISIFGLSNYIVRLPMAILGSITLVYIYYFSKNYFGEKKGICFLGFFIIFPWHMMKSRWGLESNIFPDLVLQSTILLYFFIKYDKKKYLYLSSFILGISTYSYGTSYFFVPIYFFLIHLSLILKKKLTIKQSLIQLLIVIFISFPMILFVIVNYFDLPQISFFGITIPRLRYNRFVELTSVGGNIVQNAFENFKSLITIIYKGSDGLVLNATKTFGIFYPGSILFIIIGIYFSIKNSKKDLVFVFVNILLVTSVCLSLIVPPNINRVNILWIPLMFYLIYGIFWLYELNKKIGITIATVYLIFFILFINYYFKSYNNEIDNYTRYGLDRAILYAEEKGYEKLYVDDMYIYYLYYTKMNPNDYLKRSIIAEKNVMFEYVPIIGNVYFFIPEELEQNSLYIIKDSTLSNYNIDKYSINKFGYYNVIDTKNN